MRYRYLAILFAVSFAADAAEYDLDLAHSSVTFKIKHLGISTVTGRFDKFTGTLEVDPVNLKSLKTTATIDVSSVDTDNDKRDEHLRQPDFFDAAKYPQMKFVTKEVKESGKNKLAIAGDLTLRGVTKPVVLDAEFTGALKDPWGGERAAFTATTTIKRLDFGVGPDQKLETGGLMVGNEVRIEIEIEAIKKK